MELDPGFADARNALGAALAMAGNIDEAIAHLEKAVQIDSNSFEYRYNLGRFLAAAGKFNEAIPHFEQAVSLSGGREPQSLDMLAAMYAEVGCFPEALKSARRALELCLQANNQELAAELKVRIAAYESKIPP